ncbi:N,N'-diacetylchitobiose transport system permease protein [Spinactinospora alkalitolerans]|uniref:N,N'-diacetylchitobiose transport system permease protein n=1 Tax=Spinactinospora alkalitolerans TaxID=687207 RepID=A0A852TX93_9ACTN|nr:sugar ABC transporter permease [Spinactinospora alkalitolerans]NYE49126.1 N,N'-diacetylchitobiose transport system permease protein [Spinactinospora alkalitolerans]
MTRTLDVPEPRVEPPGAPAKKAPRHRRRRRGLVPLIPYLLILPALALLIAVLVWPILQMAWMSLHTYGLRQLRGEPAEWNGFAHYLAILTDERFWTIFRNTIVVCLLMVAITMVLGTLVGILLNKLPKWFSAVVGTALMLAWATPVISAAIVHRWLFDSRYGLANAVLAGMPDWLVGSGWEGFNWFNSPGPLFSVLILTVVWQSFPFVSVSVLAGLKSVPSELYEAARVDGASAWRSFWTVTVPMLRPLFALLLILQIIWDFRIFTQLNILAGGFSNRDVFLLPYYSYQLGFASTPPNYGMGSAIAVVMTVLVLGITAYYLRVMIRQGEIR